MLRDTWPPFFRSLTRPWTADLVTREDLTTLLTELELKWSERMTTAEDQVGQKVAALIGMAVAEVQSLRASSADFAVRLAEAVAAGDQALADSLAADQARDIARASEWLAKLEEAYPADVPEVPVPAEGEPAEVPADAPGDLEVPEVTAPEITVPVVEQPAEDTGTP